MALIQCPECGKEISSESEVCIHCGYPIKEKGITEKEQEPVIQRTKPGPSQTASGIKKKKIGIIAALAIGIAAMIVVLLQILPKPKINNMKMPYGIEYGMSLSVATAQIKDSGLQLKYALTDSTNCFDSSYVYGIKTEHSTLTYYSNGMLEVTHFFTDSGHNTDNPGPEYQRILSQLKDEYGEPTDTSKGGYLWVHDRYSFSLSYYKQGKYTINYLCYPNKIE